MNTFCCQVSRLEGQVKRYKDMAEDSEKAEDDLKAEKRKMQREVCKISISVYTHVVFFNGNTRFVKTC